MRKKTAQSTKYKKYRTLYLPKPQVDLLLVTSHLTPLHPENNTAVSIGLAVINDCLTKSNIYRENDDYPYHVIPMYSKYLQTKYGNDYKNYIQWLVNHSVIWNDKPFEGYSSHYYLHSNETCIKLLKSKLSLSDINLDELLDTYCLKNNIEITSESIDINRIQEKQKSRIYSEWYRIKLPIDKSNKRYLTKDYESDSTFINNAPKHIKLMGSHYRKNLDIDDKAAILNTSERYAFELNQASSIEEEDKAYKRYSSRITSIHSIKNGRTNKSLRFHRNTTNNRLDTNLTNMASDLRPHIIGYESMAYLDLVNSQPVLFNVLLRKYHKVASESQKRELDDYLEWTSKGKWYEKLVEIYNVTRDEAKTIWMEIAYSKNSSFKHRKKVFNAKFPFISSIIQNLKRDDHANFSIELQKIESKVFIDMICKILIEEGIMPYTMHDGLLVPEEHKFRTQEVMLEQLEKVIGVRPKIKVS
jgi:hypothetical protein